MNNNKLIAEFMGWKPNEHHWCLNGDKDLQYHTSWDWLMPVVHKIDEKCRERLGLNHSLHIGDDIDAVYSQVIEFIKEHNDER